MVDSGSSVNVMYMECFNQMGLGPKQLLASLELLYGFNGDAVIPMRRIRLPLTVRDSNRQATILIDFLIINCPSAYNVVLGRPAMNDLNLIVSTKALTIKFPTPNGVRYMQGKQHLVRHCYQDAVKMGAKGKKVNVISGSSPRPTSEKGVNHDLDPRKVDCDKATGPMEEFKNITVSEVDEEKCLKLGKNLAPEVKSQLTNFLKSNLDVFAWNHEDMVGIAPEVMWHRLNVNPNYKPMY